MGQGMFNSPGVTFDSDLARQARQSVNGGGQPKGELIDEMAENIAKIADDHANGKAWQIFQYVLTANGTAGGVTKPEIINFPVSRMCLQAFDGSVNVFIGTGAYARVPGAAPMFTIDPGAQVILPGTGQPMTLLFEAASAAAKLTLLATAYGG